MRTVIQRLPQQYSTLKGQGTNFIDIAKRIFTKIIIMMMINSSSWSKNFYDNETRAGWNILDTSNNWTLAQQDSKKRLKERPGLIPCSVVGPQKILSITFCTKFLVQIFVVCSASYNIPFPHHLHTHTSAPAPREYCMKNLTLCLCCMLSVKK